MPRTHSAKKAVRSSASKRAGNLYWKSQIKAKQKDLAKDLMSKEKDIGILNTKLVALQKVLDKTAKEHVIHANKANRLKSAYAKKISTQQNISKKPTRKSK